MPEGTAENVGTNWWNIVDDSGITKGRFYRQPSSTIRDGARVTYTGVDANGIAQNVQPAAAVARYAARNAQADMLNSGQRTQLYELIMSELQAADTETGANRQNRLRRLRSAVDKF